MALRKEPSQVALECQLPVDKFVTLSYSILIRGMKIETRYLAVGSTSLVKPYPWLGFIARAIAGLMSLQKPLCGKMNNNLLGAMQLELVKSSSDFL